MRPPVRYTAETNGVVVHATPAFFEDQSSPEDDRYVWAYTIEIINRSHRTLQLMTRHWLITDCFGRAQEVRGDGVIGEQPILDPGDRFEYTSGCALTAASGVMRGSYRFVDADGAAMDVEIPMFTLDSPYDVSTPS
ncbi:Co2+/Mg2+ efflux protein ApaG [bacterium]|nr:Co2+/Mg2+ efflux protein ApaG [bacterium]